FDREKIAPEARRSALTVDMRYAGQNYELAVPLPDAPVTGATLEGLGRGFAEVHQRLYGFTAREEPGQLVTFRLEAVGEVRKAAPPRHGVAGADAAAAIGERRPVWLAEAQARVDCPVYARERLAPGNRFHGPAIVEQMDATTLVLPDMAVDVD